MSYQITVLTVSGIIPTGSASPGNNAPWFNIRSGITLNNPVLSTISVEDDDAQFDTLFYAPSENMQRLEHTATIGHGASATVLPAGTQLSSFIGSYLVDDLGNRFFVAFPRQAGTAPLGDEVGGRTAVLVFPMPRANPDGTTSYVPLDPSRSLRFDAVRNVGRTDHAVGYTPRALCFAGGTLIETAKGPRPVQTLRAGDMILTHDRGLCPLRWIGGMDLSAADLARTPRLSPIRIRRGALAPDMPCRDLVVSPQHRILLRSAIVGRMFDAPEVLVAARHLTACPGIDTTNPPEGVSYWHLLFDRHEIVRADGVWSESLFTGPQALLALDDSARRQIVALFPRIARPDHAPMPARPFPSGREARKLVERHLRNGKPLGVLSPAAPKPGDASAPAARALASG